jgi:hypothetical protein
MAWHVVLKAIKSKCRQNPFIKLADERDGKTGGQAFCTTKT